MSDLPGAGDPKPGSARPSFTGYWKRSKDQQATQSLTFVSSKLGQSSGLGENEGQTEPSTEAKAKERRQQVRKAQRQHRQRKANYTKQLEMDVTKLRDDIAKVEQEVESLRSQNGAMRSQLAVAVPTTAAAPPPAPPQAVDPTGMAFSTALAPDYTVFLDVPENAGTPVYQVRRAAPSVSLADWSSSRATSSYAAETLSSFSPTSVLGPGLEDPAVVEAALSPEQTDEAINFILGLEHCCWHHIDETCYSHHHTPSPPPPPRKFHWQEVFSSSTSHDDAEDDSALNGHALSATALALQSAPLSVFAQLGELHERLDPCPPFTITPIGDTNTRIPPTPAPPPAAIEWSSRALTLTNLRRLAGALNPSAAELAPVQAWFELAALYGAAVAADAAVLARLRRALAPEMQCVTFGAAVDRDVFEGVVARVLGFLPRSWRAALPASAPPASATTAAGAGAGGGGSGSADEEEGMGYGGGDEDIEDGLGMGQGEKRGGPRAGTGVLEWMNKARGGGR
ncbi:hypothetical protein F4825DRAFT_446831 [Nemania diffusa]|nr:hypothetical protein F4825DRAFT_446831 [Nemania diffusa]